MSINNWNVASDEAKGRKNPWDVSGSKNTPTDPLSVLNDEDVASIISSLNGANTNLFGKANSVFAGANMTYGFPTQGFKAGSDSSAPPQIQASMANPAATLGNSGSIGGGNSDSGSDILMNKLNLKDSLSAISAPVGQPPSVGGSQSRFASNLFASASVAGINVSSGNSSKLGGGSFLEKFGSVTEKTRELELNLNKMSIGNSQSPNLGSASRRSSILPNESAISTSPQATFREPATRQSRQSFSEKFDNYINSGAEGRHMSFSSDIHSEHNSISMDRSGNDSSSSHHNIWNPATATTFTPSDAQQQRVPNEFGYYNSSAPVYNQPGFMPQPMMVPPFGNNFLQMPPQMQMQMQMQMQFFNGANSTGIPSTNKENTNSTEANATNGESSANTEIQSNEDKSDSKNPSGSSRTSTEPSASSPAGIQGGLNNQSIFPSRQMSPFMIPPFSPPMYGLFNGSPGAIPPQFEGSNTPEGTMAIPDVIANVPTPQAFDLNGPPAKGLHNNNREGTFIPGNNFGNTNGMRKSPAPRNNPKRKIYRSPLLEDFRSNRTKEYFLKDIYGHGIEFSKDQHGSRFIQQQLEKASASDKEVIFNEIREVAPELMTDVFGNYVIQKFFEHGSSTQKSILLESMKGKINVLSLQMYGCRVVQKALEAVTLEEQISVLDELRDNVLVLVKDQNGNHVIQKSIECVPIEHSSFILDALRHQIYHLSTHTYGCRVIQRLLEYSHEKDQRFILDELNGFMYYLIQDQYGNYVIQHIIEHGEERDRSLIIDVVLQHIVELSKHKFASNAVEKCIIFGDADHRQKIYQAMLKDNLDRKAEVNENSPLALMMKDQYANYVVQKMVDISKGDDKTLLVLKIRKCLEQINKNNFGKHLASIEKLIALSESIPVKE